MRIGVIADTHVPTRAKAVPEAVADIFRGVDLIFHLGDLEEESVLDWLGRIAPVEAVAGNMDPPEVRRSLPRERIVEAGGFRFGLVHGSGPPAKVAAGAAKTFAGAGVDLVLYGHSHRPDSSELGGLRVFNPGSPTDRVFSPYRSVGLLTLAEKIDPRIIRLD